VGAAPFPHLLALLCGFALALVVATGCGSDRSNLIPSSRASELVNQLDAIKSAIDAGDCTGLDAKITRFHDDATSLTTPVDSRLRKRLNQGVKSLRDHALTDCQAAAAAKTSTTTTDTTTTDTTPTTTTDTTPTTTTDTTTTDTTPTDTTPTDTTTTPPADTTTTPPPTDTGAGAAVPPTANGGTPGGNGSTP
jgi:hypothetical protein